jgi:hypothetical protein
MARVSRSDYSDGDSDRAAAACRARNEAPCGGRQGASADRLHFRRRGGRGSEEHPARLGNRRAESARPHAGLDRERGSCRGRPGRFSAASICISMTCGGSSPARCLSQGPDLPDVRDFLGHANITTTSRYLQSTPLRLARVLERMEAAAGFAHDSHKPASQGQTPGRRSRSCRTSKPVELIGVIGWSGRRGSNPRHRAWEARVLPLNYSRFRRSL